MDTKTTIDEYYSKNWDKVVKIAGRQLLKIRRQDLSETLVTESYMYMTKNIDKIEPLVSSGKLESVVVNWMNKQILWGTTAFKKEWVFPDVWDEQILDDFPDSTDISEIIEYEKEHTDRWNFIQKRVESFDPIDKKIWDLAFVGPYNNSGKLSRYLNLNRTTCYYMIRGLREKLIEGYDN